MAALLGELLGHRLGVNGPTGAERLPDRDLLAPGVHDAGAAAGAAACLSVSFRVRNAGGRGGRPQQGKGNGAVIARPATLHSCIAFCALRTAELRREARCARLLTSASGSSGCVSAMILSSRSLARDGVNRLMSE